MAPRRHRSDIEATWMRPTYLATSPCTFPIPDASYDIVLSGQVIEHVGPIWDWMKELARVCRPGGLIITINPVSWHFHEAPIDCWRIYPAGMTALSEAAGLDVVLSTWESLELDELWWLLPQSLRRRKTLCQRLSGVFNLVSQACRLPLSGAYDTITIARRPSAERS
jgi:SAM-dependent methyltransferase